MNYLCTVEYVLRDEEGNLLDSTQGKGAFTFTSGRNEVIPGFEREVLSMEEGEEKTFTLPPEEAYGEYREELVEVVPRNALDGIDLEKGMILQGQTPDGQLFLVKVVDFDDEKVVLDHNHPLAGKSLTFTVKLLGKELV